MQKPNALRGSGLVAFTVFGLLSHPANAQVTPSDVRDLIGARAAGAESELASRGYVPVGGQAGTTSKSTNWWNDRRGVCLAVTTSDGRYSSVVSAPAADCREGNNADFRPPEFGLGSSARGDYEEHIAVICYGEGEKMTGKTESGYEWDSTKKKYVPKSGFTWKNEDYNTSVTVEIDGNKGRIRPAKNMVPPLHSGAVDGWYEIRNMSVSRDIIRGQFRLNGANRPKITIDRRAGRIIIDGLTKFAGTCDALDSDRKF